MRANKANGIMKFDLSSEDELLLRCAKLELSSDQTLQLVGILMQGNISWPRTLLKARWHRISALVYRHLRNPLYEHRIPIGISRDLERDYHGNLARSLTLRPELREILDALGAERIPTIVLKGAALVEQVYGEIGLRPMRDLDILVPFEKADLAFSIIQDLGYAAREDFDRQRERRLSHQHHSQLFGLEKLGIIEIHTHILEARSPLRFDIAGFWERAVETDIAGTRAMTLAPEDQLTHLAIHFFKDRHLSSYSALGQLCDIALVTRHYEDSIDWSILLREVTANGLSGPVFLGLYLALELLDAPVPNAVLNDLKPEDFRRRDAERFIRQRVFGRKVIAKGLIAPNDSYNWRSVPLATIKRIFPNRTERFSTSNHHALAEPKPHNHHFYFRRIGRVMAAAAAVIAHPIRAFEDIASDRWLHSLYSAGHTNQRIMKDSHATSERVANKTLPK